MLFLLIGLAFAVLVLWSVASTPRVIRRFGNPRVWLWWACWLVAGAMIALASFEQGWEEIFG